MKKALRWFGQAFLVLMDVIWILAAIALCAAWWAGWIYKDSTEHTTALYYVPAIAFIIAGFLWLFFTLSHRFRVVQFLVFATVISCFVKILVVDHNWNRRPETLPDDNIRILHRNTAWGVSGVESIVRTITNDLPDIIVITEPPRLDMISDVAYQALDVEHVFTSDGITLGSRFPITYLGDRRISDIVAWHARIDTDQGSFILIAANLMPPQASGRGGPVGMAIDLASEYLPRTDIDRESIINRLTKWIDSIDSTLPKVFIADLNTPHDSTLLKPFRKRMRFAYESNGRGWPYSWPVPLPSYAIDHTWVSFNVTVNDYVLKKSQFSDHKQQIADVSFETKIFEMPAENGP